MEYPSGQKPENDPQFPKELMDEAVASLERQRLTGINGWLLVHVVLQVVGGFYTLWNILSPSTAEWDMLFPGISVQIASFQPFSMILGLVDCIGIVYALSLLFNRKKSAPRAIIILLFYQLISSLISFFVIQSFVTAYTNAQIPNILILSVLMGVALQLAWVTYFTKSKRVQYTCIRD